MFLYVLKQGEGVADLLSNHKIKGNDYIYASIKINGYAKWFYVGAGKKLRLAQIIALTHKINAFVLHIPAKRKHRIDLRSYTAVYNHLLLEAMQKDILVLSST